MFFVSHQGIQPFGLARPATVADAVATRASDSTAAYLSGGVDLIPALRNGQRANHVVWLKGIPGLAVIRHEGDTLVIGAAATYRQIETDPTVRALLPGLSQVWEGVANIRVRVAGSFGGNIMAGNPVYDALPAAIALNAQLGFATSAGTGSVDAGAPLPEGALLVDVRVPLGTETRFAMDRSLKPAISVAVVLRQSGDGVTARAAVGCAYPQPWGADVGTVENLAGIAADADTLAERFAESMPEPLTDHNASATYRRRMTRVLIARQLKALAAWTTIEENISVALTINGRDWQGEVPANLMLVDLLRDDLRLTGAKIACDQAVCGACTILVDGAPGSRVQHFRLYGRRHRGRDNRRPGAERCAQRRTGPPSSTTVRFSAATARRDWSCWPRRCCARTQARTAPPSANG